MRVVGRMSFSRQRRSAVCCCFGQLSDDLPCKDVDQGMPASESSQQCYMMRLCSHLFVVARCCLCAALRVPSSVEHEHTEHVHDAGMSVRMLTERDHEGPESGLEIELILDSGADASCLPLDLCDIGEPAKDGLEHTPFTDAQGNRLQFLVANVGNPILAVGKLSRAGFGVFHKENQMYLGNDEVKIPVYLRNVTFFEYLEKIVLYCYKKNNDLKFF